MFFALLLVASTGVPTSSEAAFEVYRQACVDGVFQLTPERGELIDSRRMPDIILYSDFSARGRNLTYIRMKKPPNTFLVIEKYDPDQKSKFESVCRVASREMTQKDVERAFFAGAPSQKYMDMRDSGHPFEPYVIDAPKAGFRKRLFVHDDWVMIETAIYKQAQ
jgi:hypothetical protein